MKIKAYAKINLSLDILGKRDDGYHLVDMIMQTVSLFDIVDVKLNDSGKITVASTNSLLGGENDITYKAAKLFSEYTDKNCGIDIFIEKHIPLAAGLGGGSSDAAAVIVALNRLLETNLSKEQLADICVKLGADVPYFIYGGTVSVSGIGEIFKPLKPLEDCYIVVAKDGVKASTGENYRRLDAIKNLIHPNNSKAIEFLEKGDLKSFCTELKNVFSALWNTEHLKNLMDENGAICTVLSGSGPSFFGIFENQESAKKAFEAIEKKGIEVYLTIPEKVPNVIIE